MAPILFLLDSTVCLGRFQPGLPILKQLQGSDIVHTQAVKSDDSHTIYTSDSDSRSEALPLPLPVLSYGSESSAQKPPPANKADSVLVIQKSLPGIVGLGVESALYGQT